MSKRELSSISTAAGGASPNLVPLPEPYDVDEDAAQRIADMMASVPIGDDSGIFYFSSDDAATPPPQMGEAGDLRDILAICAVFDQSDTDNGKRLMHFFGRDLRVISQAGVQGGTFLNWCGTHWDIAGSVAGALVLAQQVGDLINLEVDFMEATTSEAKSIAAGKDAERDLAKLENANTEKMEKEALAAHRSAIADARAIVGAGKDARAALNARRLLADASRCHRRMVAGLNKC